MNTAILVLGDGKVIRLDGAFSLIRQIGAGTIMAQTFVNGSEIDRRQQLTMLLQDITEYITDKARSNIFEIVGAK